MARKSLGTVPAAGNSSNLLVPTSWITTALNLKLDKTGLSASTPLSYNSGTGALSIQAASTTQDGYLSSANFNAFNNKENAISSGTTSQYWRGDKSWQDLPSAIRGTVLSGLVAGTNQAITATDSILVAFQNLQAQVNNKLGSTAQATDSDKLDGQHGSYYQTALGYTPLKNTTDTLTGDLTLSGGSLYLPATGFSGAGPIQSTVAVKFANATAAQEAYMLKLRLGGTWSILDSNDPGNGGIYASGNIKADGSFIGSGANLTSIPPAALLAGGSDGQVPVKSGTTWAWGNTGGLSLSSPLTGYSLGTDSTALSANDTLLQGFQKLQLQQNNAKTYTDNVASTIQPAALAAAIGDWSSYTPTLYGSSNIGSGGGAFFKYRREGDSVRIRGTITVGTGGSITSTIQWTLPAGLTARASKFPADSYNYMNVGTATVHDSRTSVSSPYTITYVDGTNNRFQALGQRHDGAWNYVGASNFPMTWAPSDQLFIDMLVPVNEWQANINLAQDFREYACNSSTTTTDDLTSFSNSPDGAFVKAFSPSGRDSVRKRVRFSRPLRHSDLLMLQVSLTTSGDDWVDYRDISWGMTTNSSGSEFYGMGLRRVPESATDVDINFWSRPLAGSYFAWPSSDIYRWRVVKISNGNFAESGSDSYSTTETLTNKKWIDGKPIYRKVVDFGALPNVTTKSVAHGISGATAFVSVTGVAANSGVNIQLPYNSPTGLTAGISLVANASNIDITTGVDRSAWSAKIILEYTK